MQRRAGMLVCGVFLLVVVSGCPVTDDYYVESSHVDDPMSGTGETSNGGSAAGDGSLDGGSASAHAGTDGSMSGAVAGKGEGGASEPARGGATSDAGAPSGTCEPSTERCNGHDDDCDELVDELACNAAQGCSGFVITARPEHGYMLCIQKKDYAHAQAACAAQNMRLAWLESAAENAEVAKKVAALAIDTEVVFGADDIAYEGKWFWNGGAQFWNGSENGTPVEGRFNAWTPGTPNNANDNEDCAVMLPMSADWGDRNCAATYAYLCEEPEP
jgi:hypothetical protein